jgi:quinol monooxygenase YgiN
MKTVHHFTPAGAGGNGACVFHRGAVIMARTKETPMPSILVTHTVKDYAAWRIAFDAHAPMRKAGGDKGSRVFRSSANPNEVTIICEWDNAANARRFLESPDLRQAMEKAGVVGKPNILVLDEVR